jgi:hypothetical protein
MDDALLTLPLRLVDRNLAAGALLDDAQELAALFFGGAERQRRIGRGAARRGAARWAAAGQSGAARGDSGWTRAVGG